MDTYERLETYNMLREGLGEDITGPIDYAIEQPNTAGYTIGGTAGAIMGLGAAIVGTACGDPMSRRDFLKEVAKRGMLATPLIGSIGSAFGRNWQKTDRIEDVVKKLSDSYPEQAENIHEYAVLKRSLS